MRRTDLRKQKDKRGDETKSRGENEIDGKTDQRKQEGSDQIEGDSRQDSKQADRSRPKMEERVNELKT